MAEPVRDAPRASLSGIRLLFATAAEGDRAGLYASLGMGLAGSLLTPLFPLVFRILVDGAVRGRTGVVTVAAVALAVLSAAGQAAWSYGYMFGWNVWERMTFTIDEHLVSMTARLGLIDRVERPEFVEHMTLVRTNREQFQESMMSLVGAALLTIEVILTVVILATVAPLLLLLPLFSAAPIAASRWAETKAQRALKESAEDTRTADGFALLAIE